MAMHTASTWTPTLHLRWHQPLHSAERVLQQLWYDPLTFEREWRDVPIHTADD